MTQYWSYNDTKRDWNISEEKLEELKQEVREHLGRRKADPLKIMAVGLILYAGLVLGYIAYSIFHNEDTQSRKTIEKSSHTLVEQLKE
jgi:uncharacterized membrane protein YukC